MQVQEIMTQETAFVSAGASLREAASLMSTRGIGFLPVRSGGQLVGVVTDRDLALRPTQQELPYEATTVRDVMSSSAHAVRSTASVTGAVQAMKAKNIRRLLVLDGESRLVGVLSLSDVARRHPDPRLAGDLAGHLAAVREDTCRERA
jgi:CBS domain-containing protein